MSKLIIFGAGASYGSDTINTPPISNQLFDILASFSPNTWGALNKEQRLLFLNDFENGMKRISEINPHALPPLQRAMAAYFFSFSPRDVNLYMKLARKILRSNWKGVLTTYNYERLLELSLLSVGIQPVVGSQAISNQIELCIPHGTCHIFCDSVRGAASGVSFSGIGVSTDGPVSVVSNSQEFHSRIINDAFPPVMSYFLPSKKTTSGVSFINNQRKRFIQLVNEANKIAVVGLRLRKHDIHIWEPLESTNAKILYVSGKSAGDEYREWMNRNRQNKNDEVLDSYFADSFNKICSFIELI